jgi:hypothetical protein
MEAWLRHSRSARDCFSCSYFFLLPSCCHFAMLLFVHGGNHMSKTKDGMRPTSVAGALVAPLVVTSHHRSPPSLAGLQVPCRLRGSLSLCLRI